MPQSYALFYRGKRVLVTGHTGFTGGWLVAWLKLLGAKVCGYGLPPSSRPNFFDATLLDRGITSIFADLRDRETLANTFAESQPEVIFHTAHARHSSSDPVEVFSINVIGTINLLEEARLTGSARAIVLISSAAQSWNASKCNLRRISSWPLASRTAAESAALAFADSFFVESRTRTAAARFPKLISGGDWSETGLISDLVHGITAGEPIAVSDEVFHCWHVLDAASACLNLGEALYASESPASAACDFTCAARPILQAEFAKQFLKHWGSKGPEIEVIQSQRSEPDTSRAETQVCPGSICNLSLEQAIAWTVDWYRAYLADPASAWRTTDAQIEEYGKLLSAPAASPG